MGPLIRSAVLVVVATNSSSVFARLDVWQVTKLHFLRAVREHMSRGTSSLGKTAE
jgi:hypothetical protein